MKKSVILSILFLYTAISFAQKNNTFQKLIEQTNHYLDIYDILSPYEQAYSFEEVLLTNRDKKDILANTEDYSFITKDSIGSFDLIYYTAEKIIYGVNAIVNHKKFNEFTLKDLITNDALSIVKSTDSKLYNFSLDEKTGGSYRSRISWMHYIELKTDTIYNNIDVLSKSLPNIFSAFEGDGFTNIDTIPTPNGVKYVLTGSVKTCGACYLTYIQLVSFRNGSFETDFSYYIDSRDFETSINYTPKTKRITITYNTDDLTSECSCTNYSESDYNNYYSNDNDLVEKSCLCIFEFDGTNFKLLKESAQKIKRP